MPGATRVRTPLPRSRVGRPLHRPARRPLRPILRTAVGRPYDNGTRPSKLLQKRARQILRHRARQAAWSGLRKGTRALAGRTRYALVPPIPRPFTVPPANVPIRMTAAPGPRHPRIPLPVPEKGTTEVTGQIDAVNDAWASLAAYTPENATEFRHFLGRMGEMFTNAAQSVNTLAERTNSEFPFTTGVADSMREIASGLASVSDHAMVVLSVFQQQHADELERIDNPRPNEEIWDVSRNR